MLIALRPGQVIDGTGAPALRGHAVLIEGERIVALLPPGDPLPEAARLVECPDLTLLPGLIDLQGYLSVDPNRPEPMRQIFGVDHVRRAWTAARHLKADLAAGVTTLRSMGEGDFLDVTAREAIAAGELEGPEVIPCGYPIAPSHSHQADPGGAGHDGVEGVRRAIRHNVRHGALWVKLVVTGGLNSRGLGGRTQAYARDEIEAAVEEASRLGIPLGAAANGGPGVALVASLGVASVEHGALFGPTEYESLIRYSVPLVVSLGRTLHPEGIERSAGGDPAILARLQAARLAIRTHLPAALRSGLRISLGSDNMHGLLWRDVAELVALGVAPEAAIAAATSTAARILGRNDIGSVAVGCRADLIFLRDDPLRRMEALGEVEHVVQGGRMPDEMFVPRRCA